MGEGSGVDMNFIKVKQYSRGLSNHPVESVVNVDHIVSFFESYLNYHDGSEVPCVYVDTTRTSGLIFACTLDELVFKIKNERIANI